MNFIFIFDLRYTIYEPALNCESNRKLDWNVFRSHFQTFILIFPDRGGVGIQKFRREFAARAREQLFGLFRRVFVGGVVIARALALAVVPMRDGVDRFVLQRPRFDFGADVGGNILELDERFAAMLADQTGLAHVAREQRQERRAAARRFRVGGGRRDEALEPDLFFVRDLRGEAIRADERMREPPRAAFELAECLREPAREREVVPILKRTGVFLPERVERRRRFRFKCHADRMARRKSFVERRCEIQSAILFGSLQACEIS